MNRFDPLWMYLYFVREDFHVSDSNADGYIPSALMSHRKFRHKWPTLYRAQKIASWKFTVFFLFSEYFFLNTFAVIYFTIGYRKKRKPNYSFVITVKKTGKKYVETFVNTTKTKEISMKEERWMVVKAFGIWFWWKKLRLTTDITTEKMQTYRMVEVTQVTFL